MSYLRDLAQVKPSKVARVMEEDGDGTSEALAGEVLRFQMRLAAFALK